MILKLKNIKLLLLDVDGVLTTGDIIYNDSRVETKVFSVKDGFGIRLLLNAGIKVGIVTGRSSGAILHRCADLGIHIIYDAIKQKDAILDEIFSQNGLAPEEVAFVGDDLPDIPLLKKVGASIAVADAHENVKSVSDMVTVQKGGYGAVREICEAILKAKGLWEEIIREWE